MFNRSNGSIVSLVENVEDVGIIRDLYGRCRLGKSSCVTGTLLRQAVGVESSYSRMDWGT
jgi:hypothetical protein